MGEYQLLEELGIGGMGAVYKALQANLDRVVALKVLSWKHMDDQGLVARFYREMKAVGRLNHPNIVQALDAREIDETPILAMEYVEGPTLSQIVKRCGPLPITDACELIRQAAIGLHYAHENGMVHRDIKPANLMLASSDQPSATSQPSPSPRAGEGRGEGAMATVKILDLGLARLQVEAVGDLTSTGMIMGTLDYMAPEQCEHFHGVDHRADIDPQRDRTIKLWPGKYDIRLEEERVGLSLSTESFEMKRNGEVTVAVRYEPKLAGTEIPRVDQAPPDAKRAEPEWQPGSGANVLPGIVHRPATLPGIKRWQVETKLPRQDVFSLAWSPDDRLLACGTRTGHVRVYDAETWKLVKLFVGHEGSVNSVAWHPSGKRLASSCKSDYTVRIWSLDGHHTRVFSCRDLKNAPQVVAWNPDGTELAVCASESSVRIWDLNGRVRRDWKGGNGGSAFAWSPDGQWLATGPHGETAKVQLWKPDGTAGPEFAGHTGRVESLAWSPDSQWLASGSKHDGTVRLWKPDGTKGPVFEPGGNVHCVTWSPDGKRLALAGGSFRPGGPVQIWSVEGGFEKAFNVCPGNVWSVAWSPDGRRVAAGDEGCSIHIIGEGGRRKMKGSYHAVEKLAWNRQGTVFAGTCRQLRWWRPEGTQTATAFSKGGGGFSWAPDGGRLVDNKLQLFNANGAILHRLSWEVGQVWSVACNPDGQTVALGGGSGSLRIMNLDGTVENVLDGHSVAVYVAWHPQGKLLASGDRSGQVRIWHSDGEPGPVMKHDGGVGCLDWSPDGQWLAVAGTDPQVFRSDGTLECELVPRGAHHGVLSATWSPDSKRLALAHHCGTVSVWSSEGSQQKLLDGHRGVANTVDWSPDGNQLLSGGDDGTIMSWDPDTGEVQWTTILLNDGQYAMFNAAGQLIHGEPEVVEDQLVYVVEAESGDHQVLTRSAFLKRISGVTTGSEAEGETP